MRPDLTEQLHGIRRVLAETVAPRVDDEYAAGILAGLLGTIDLLAEAWIQIPGFLRWDSEATGEVLRSVGQQAPPLPDDPLDLRALQAHHRDVRARLEANMAAVIDDGTARAKMIQLFRDRADRYPFAARRQGGSAAHPTR